MSRTQKFEPDTGYPDIFVVFLSPSRQIAAQQLKAGHLRLFLHSLQFSLNQIQRLFSHRRPHWYLQYCTHFITNSISTFLQNGKEMGLLRSSWSGHLPSKFQMPLCWLEVSIRKVLRPATSTQVFLGFPMSISKRSDGSQHSKLPLHASHVALQT